MKKIKRALVTIISSFLVLLTIIFSVILVRNTIALKNNSISSFFGYSISYVKTSSMEPTIMAGDTVLIKKGKIEDVNVGDIIVYYDSDKYIIHRVKEKSDTNVIKTQGDNKVTNPTYDKVDVTKDNFYGVYIKTVNYLNLKSLINKRNIILPIFILLYLSLMIYEGISIWCEIKKNSDKKIRELKRIKHEEELEQIRKEISDQLRKDMEEQNKN